MLINEMDIGCQRNGHWHCPWHWAATNHLCESVAGQCAGRGCAL